MLLDRSNYCCCIRIGWNMNLQDYSRFISKQNRGKNPPGYDDGVSRCFPSSFFAK